MILIVLQAYDNAFLTVTTTDQATVLNPENGSICGVFGPFESDAAAAEFCDVEFEQICAIWDAV